MLMLLHIIRLQNTYLMPAACIFPPDCIITILTSLLCPVDAKCFFLVGTEVHDH